MRHLFASFSRLLAIVLALTVLAPGFGWQSAGGLVGEAQAASAENAHAMLHGGEADCADCAEHAAHAGDDCGERHHHCCPGHILGHLPGQVAGNLMLPLPARDDLAVDRNNRRFSSRFPDGLERPPRVAGA